MTDKVTGQTNTATPSSDDPRIGSTLAGRYRILAPLGEGGMGMVYRGVHEALRKPVAIKFLQQKIHGNREMAARFEREAVTAANLRHPNIAEAIDFGTLPDGTLYLVMELVDGVALRKLIVPGRGLPVERVLRILDQIASALDLAHSMGIVHRDLKPENILVFDRGPAHDVVKIIDFGIARITSEMFKTGPTALTAAGSVFGTPQYMAPEQVMGQPVDGRADQYAIGIIAFEMLTGSQPFTADTYGDLIMKQVGAPAPRVTEFASNVPKAIDDAVYQMMSKLPDERFTSVSEAFRFMKGDGLPQALPTNSIPTSSSTILMSSPNIGSATGTHTGAIAFAATVAPGEQLLSLPNAQAAAAVPAVAVTPVALRSEVSSVIKVDPPAPAAAPAAAPTAPTPEPAPKAPEEKASTPQLPAATSAQPASKPPSAKIAVIGAAIVAVCLVVVFFVVRSQDSNSDDATSQADKAAASSRTMATPPTTAATTAAATRRPVTNTKYRFLLKDGKYPFCVTSKLRNAYPVRTNAEGVQVCVGTPDGAIPIEGLKSYTTAEIQWE
ncbi:MAG TPA: serine/threonine-protein kinase [Polyangium sp.]|nr:serine/threonine-protein kinase [Polyangium sp.]